MSSISNVFENMRSRLTAEKAKKINSSYLFNVGSHDNEKWSVDLRKESDWIIKSDKIGKEDCIITIPNSEDWISIASGKISPIMAFTQGKIEVKGDMSLALKLQTLLS